MFGSSSTKLKSLLIGLALLGASAAAQAQVCQCSGDATVPGNLTVSAAVHAQEVVASTQMSVPWGDFYCGRDAYVAGAVTAGTKLATDGHRASATPGIGQGVEEGALFADTIPRGWAFVTGSGAKLVRGANVLSVTKISAGAYLVRLVHGPKQGQWFHAYVNLSQPGIAYAIPLQGPGTVMAIYTNDAAGYPMDADFSAVFFGG